MKKTSPEKKQGDILVGQFKENKSSSFHARKTVILSILIGLFLFGTYSFLPQIKDLWSSISQGPAMVLSFLKDDPATLKQNEGVTNILLVGIDKRSFEPYSYDNGDGTLSSNGFLADTLILASYSHEDHSVVLLSLPRDLWVEVPAFEDVYKQHTKINATYSIGSLYGYEGGGIALTKDVVSSILDIPIHYSARIDFEGFVEAIDLLGGVDIEVENTFDDWRYPREGYENAPLTERFTHLHFDAGWQHMNGETALRYARSRQGTNGEGSDFARASRQQKVIMAVRDKANNMGFFESLPKITELLNTFGESVETDMTPNELFLFYKIGKDFDENSIQTHVLDNGDKEEGLLYNPPKDQFGGGWVLLPIGDDWSVVHEYIQDILYLDRMGVYQETPLEEEAAPATY